MNLYYGKYRGKVVNNIDPDGRGRVQVSVSSILAEGRLSWAMPCSPFAGSQVGFYAVPPIGANVWVEFEGGDPDYPILAGCFWGAGECPATPGPPLKRFLKTDSATITIDDTPGAGGITLELVSGAKVKVSATGIEIDNGQGASIKMSGPSVNVNSGALEVT